MKIIGTRHGAKGRRCVRIAVLCCLWSSGLQAGATVGLVSPMVEVSVGRESNVFQAPADGVAGVAPPVAPVSGSFLRTLVGVDLGVAAPRGEGAVFLSRESTRYDADDVLNREGGEVAASGRWSLAGPWSLDGRARWERWREQAWDVEGAPLETPYDHGAWEIGPGVTFRNDVGEASFCWSVRRADFETPASTATRALDYREDRWEGIWFRRGTAAHRPFLEVRLERRIYREVEALRGTGASAQEVGLPSSTGERRRLLTGIVAVGDRWRRGDDWVRLGLEYRRRWDLFESYFSHREAAVAADGERRIGESWGVGAGGVISIRRDDVIAPQSSPESRLRKASMEGRIEVFRDFGSWGRASLGYGLEALDSNESSTASFIDRPYRNHILHITYRWRG